MNRVVFAAAIFAVWGAQVPSAQAYECLTGACPRWCRAVPYGITDTSPDLGEATTVSETRRGMDDWTTRSCTSLSNNYTGRGSGAPRGGDGRSEIGWIESGWSHGSSAIGVTIPRWGGDNCIVEADMEMNGVNYNWITGPGRGSDVNTYSIALHEGGHYYGLGHSSSRSAAMYFAYGGGTSSISSDDEAGICFLYPGSGPGGDCTTTGCPAGQECVDAVCRPIMGDGSFCSPCTSSGDCSGDSACLGYAPGTGYCGTRCSGAGDCPPGGQCVNTDAGPFCVGVVDGRLSCDFEAGGCSSDADCPGQRCNPTTRECEDIPPTGADLGEPCDGNVDCLSGICSVGACSEPCDGFNAGSCRGGFYCDGDANGGCGTGLCRRGGPGAAAFGAACMLDTDCSTLMCAGGVCTAPCQPGGVAGCAEGQSCQPAAVPGCGMCRPAADLGQVGDPCMGNTDCASGLCASRGGADDFCTDFCGAEQPCPDGLTCQEIATDVAVCVPTPTTAPGTAVSGGCGCVVRGADSEDHRGAWVLAGLMALLVWRRRR